MSKSHERSDDGSGSKSDDGRIYGSEISGTKMSNIELFLLTYQRVNRHVFSSLKRQRDMLST